MYFITQFEWLKIIFRCYNRDKCKINLFYSLILTYSRKNTIK